MELGIWRVGAGGEYYKLAEAVFHKIHISIFQNLKVVYNCLSWQLHFIRLLKFKVKGAIKKGKAKYIFSQKTETKTKQTETKNPKLKH